MFRKLVKNESTGHIYRFLNSKSLKTTIKIGIAGKLAYDLYKDDYEKRFTLQSISSSEFHRASDEAPLVPEEKVNVQKESDLKKILKCFMLLFGFGYGILFLLSRHPSFLIPILMIDIVLNEGKSFTFPSQLLNPFLIKPIDPIISRNFQQENFIDLINNQHLPITFESKGICYGLTLLWYLHEMNGKDFISELNEVSNRIATYVPLSEMQIKLLKDISTIQTHQSHRDTFVIGDHKANFLNLLSKQIKLKMNNILYNSPINYQQKMIDLTLEEAINHPNSLIAFRPSGSNFNHIIGVTAAFDGCKWKFKYFDSNLKEVSSDNVEAIRISMQQLISKYASRCNKLMVNNFSLKEKEHSLFWKPSQSLGKSPAIKNTETYEDKFRKQM